VADQPFLAAAVQQLGAGLALDGESGPDAIRTAVKEVIGQPSYTAAAGKLAAAIQAAPGAAGAAVELERLALTGGTSPPRNRMSMSAFSRIRRDLSLATPRARFEYLNATGDSGWETFRLA
jgi:hypothetical protein